MEASGSTIKASGSTPEDNNQWIRLSVFYPRIKGHALINSCLYPMLKELQEKRLITIYILALSGQQGENLRLSVSAKKSSALAVSKKLEDGIRSYLQRHPAATIKVVRQISGFFMDVADNSVFYNMFGRPGDIPAENTMRYRLTNSFIRAMCTEPISNSNTLSFLLYIQACVLRLHCPLRPEAAARMSALVRRAAERLPGDRIAEMDRQRDSLFARNRAELLGIIDEVWREKPADPATRWLGDWNSAIRRYFEQQPGLDGGYETISFFAVLQADYPDKGVSYLSSGLLALALQG
jgi:hypothetical protein